LLHDILEITPKPEFIDVYGDQRTSNLANIVSLSGDAYEKAPKVAPTWDVYFLEQE